MKKIFAMILSLVLVLAVAAGCGAKTTKKDVKATTTTQQTVKKVVNNGQNKDANVAANSGKITIDKNGTYTDKESVAKYIYQYKKLPSNYITKSNAKKLGWQTKGTLDKVAPGKSIGGDRYGDYEKKLQKHRTKPKRHISKRTHTAIFHAISIFYMSIIIDFIPRNIKTSTM